MEVSESSSSDSSSSISSDESIMSSSDDSMTEILLWDYVRRLRARGIIIPRIRLIQYMRVDLDTLFTQHLADPSFERWIRMKRSSFVRLTNMLRHQLSHDFDGNELRRGVISPEMCVFMTLRYLAGHNYLCIKFSVSVSKSCHYHIVNKTLAAICDCQQLAIAFPSTKEDCERIAEGFQNVSTKAAIVNCVGAVDGYLLAIQAPSAREVSNVRSYYSGHYSKYGINVQAVCDSNCVFTYFALTAPGSTNDRVAMQEKIDGTSLHDLIESLPETFVVVADAAYESTEHCVSMFYGAQRLNPAHDNFNYCASQCRIRIEMAFGQMQSKWTILKRSLTNSLENVKFVAMAAAILHNFAVKERLHTNEEDYFQVPGEIVDATVPNQRGRGAEAPIAPNDNQHMYRERSQSNIRDTMVVRVAQLGISRPLSSVMHERNQNINMD